MLSDHPAAVGWLKIVISWAAYLSAISLTQWQALVAIFGGLVVIVFTSLQIYVLWRDKIVKYRAPGSATRKEDKTEPMPL